MDEGIVTGRAGIPVAVPNFNGRRKTRNTADAASAPMTVSREDLSRVSMGVVFLGWICVAFGMGSVRAGVAPGIRFPSSFFRHLVFLEINNPNIVPRTHYGFDLPLHLHGDLAGEKIAVDYLPATIGTIAESAFARHVAVKLKITFVLVLETALEPTAGTGDVRGVEGKILLFRHLDVYR